MLLHRLILLVSFLKIEKLNFLIHKNYLIITLLKKKFNPFV